MTHTRLFIFSLITLVIICACAHVVPLKGGEPDVRKPYITGIYPANKSTNIDRDLNAVFQFSEWISDRQNTFRSAVSISPPLNKVLRYEVNGDQLIITSNAVLDSNTTYNIVLSTSVTDLNNNSLISPFHLTFSTGDTIDTLELAGSVQYPLGVNSKLKSNIKIGLYPFGPSRAKYGYLSDFADSNGVMSNEPNIFAEKPLYITGTDTTGEFIFKGLKKGMYELIAFEDQNKNTIFNLPNEKIAIASKKVFIGSKNDDKALTLVSLDTNKLMLSGVEPEYPNRLMVKFSDRPHKDKALDKSNYTVMSLDSSKTYAISDIYLHPKKQTPVLTIDSLEQDSMYVIHCAHITDSMDIGLDTARNYTSFTWRTQVDSIPARAITMIPTSNSKDQRLDTSITIMYDKPIFVDSINYMIVAAEDTLEFKKIQIAANAVRLKTVDDLPNSATAVISYLQPDTIITTDTTLPIDTTIEFRSRRIFSFNTFELINAAALKGNVPEIQFGRRYSKPLAVKLSIQNLKTKNIYSTPVTSSGTFSFEQVPEGPYFMEYYIDRNDNNRWDQGSLKPYTHSEPYYRIKDTLHLARGEENDLQTLLEPKVDSTVTNP